MIIRSCATGEKCFGGGEFELILTVEMVTRHPVGGSFSSIFSASVIIAEL